MTEQLGPSFDKRLRAELDRFRPPTPRPEMARFSRMPAGYGPLRFLKPATVVVAALALLTVAASAASGSPNPSVWKQRAVTTVEEVTQGAQPSPTPEPVKPPAAQPAPASQPEPSESPEPSGSPEPSESPEPNRDSPEPTDGAHQEPTQSPESSYIDGAVRYESYPAAEGGATYQGGSDA